MSPYPSPSLFTLDLPLHITLIISDFLFTSPYPFLSPAPSPYSFHTPSTSPYSSPPHSPTFPSSINFPRIFPRIPPLSILLSFITSHTHPTIVPYAITLQSFIRTGRT